MFVKHEFDFTHPTLLTLKMAVKVFGAILMFSYIPLCIMSDCGYKNITEDEFDTFKGIDIEATCRSANSMKEVCTKIANTCSSLKNKPLENGYPTCTEKKIQLQKGTQELAFRNVKLLLCSWEGDTTPSYFGKGQGPNHVMNYNCDPSSCLPYNDLKVK